MGPNKSVQRTIEYIYPKREVSLDGWTTVYGVTIKELGTVVRSIHVQISGAELGDPYEKQAGTSEGVIKPLYISAKDAETRATDVKPIKIKRRYPNDPHQCVEYANGPWRYLVTMGSPRGRSTVHHGTLVVDASYVQGAGGDSIRTPFGRMGYADEKRGYFRGWGPTEE
jgi:hypothetical protein